MKIAAIQMDIIYGDPDSNFKHAESNIIEAAAQGAEIAVLPEMWNTGFDLERLPEIADVDGIRTREMLQRLARENHIAIIGGSTATKKQKGYFNTTYVADKNGDILSTYDKAHLFQLMDEHHYLQSGNAASLFEIEDIPMGSIICYDLRFPEWIRHHVIQGAQCMFVPAQWPEARTDHWKILLQARAIENQCFIIAVNRVGTDPNNNFAGNSMMIAPWGDVLWTGENKEMIHIENIDVEQVKVVRNRIPVFQDRRPDLYEY